MIIGAIPTTSKCCAQALNELLNRPDKLGEAQQAARSDDDLLLAQYVFEALRFNPNNPGLFRVAAQDYTVAKDKMHATLIPRGTTVIAATQSAMFDDSIVDAPNEFRIGRPEYAYMHFGYGLHTCFGQYLNRVSDTWNSEAAVEEEKVAACGWGRRPVTIRCLVSAKSRGGVRLREVERPRIGRL